MGTVYHSRSFRFWTATVEQKYRLRLSSELAEVTSWLKAEDGFRVDSAGYVGPDGQLQLSAAVPNAAAIQQIENSLLATQARIDEMPSSASSRLIKFAAMSWIIPIVFEQGKGKRKYKRFTLTLPKEARQLSIVPNEVGDVVAVFAMGPILEIWKTTDWTQHGASIRANMPSLISAALEEIEGRSE